MGRPHPLPGLSPVPASVHPVPEPHMPPADVLAGSHPHGGRVGGIEGQTTDGIARLIVEDGLPVGAPVGALEDSAVGGEEDRVRLGRVPDREMVVGMCDPLGNPAAIQELAARGVTQLALELIPRITRGQSMDVLSSQATIAGYQAVLLAALELPKMFPMMMTAAGTLSPVRAFVIGAGVAVRPVDVVTTVQDATGAALKAVIAGSGR